MQPSNEQPIGETGHEHANGGVENEVEQGVVYPPPPSYYQNMPDTPVSPVRPALPSQPVANAPFAFHSPGQQAQLYQAGVQVPPYPPAQFPWIQPPVKRSYKWVWIIVAILTAGLLASGGLCAWAFYDLYNTTFKQATGSTNVVNDYLQHIQNQRYADAYNDLHISGLKRDDFIARAQASDTQDGNVLSFVVGQPTFSTDSGGPDLSKWRFTVDVKRAKTSYPVLLTVQNVGGSWKITYYDRI